MAVNKLQANHCMQFDENAEKDRIDARPEESEVNQIKWKYEVTCVCACLSVVNLVMIDRVAQS